MLEVRVKKSLPGFHLDVAFSVDQEILAILGPSGSGKTMTLQCIAGLVRPDEGYIKLNDKVLLDSSCKTCLPPRTRKVGFVFQNYALFPNLTVKENIAYGISELPRPEIESKVAQWLEKMNIGGLEKRYPRQLSADSNSASPWRVPSPPSRKYCCLMSRFPPWIRRSKSVWSWSSWRCKATIRGTYCS